MYFDNKLLQLIRLIEHAAVYRDACFSLSITLGCDLDFPRRQSLFPFSATDVLASGVKNDERGTRWRKGSERNIATSFALGLGLSRAKPHVRIGNYLAGEAGEPTKLDTEFHVVVVVVVILRGK